MELKSNSLNIIEVMGLPLGTEVFPEGNEHCILTVKERGYTGTKVLWHNQEQKICCLTNMWINCKYKIRKKDLEVSFEEAIQTYGREVYCIWIDNDNIKRLTKYNISTNINEINDCNGAGITPIEILEGKWFIVE